MDPNNILCLCWRGNQSILRSRLVEMAQELAEDHRAAVEQAKINKETTTPL